MVPVLTQIERVEVLGEPGYQDKIDHLSASFLPFQNRLGRVRMRRVCNARGAGVGLREDAGSIGEGVRDGGELSQDTTQTPFEFFICLYQLVLSKVFVW